MLSQIEPYSIITIKKFVENAVPRFHEDKYYLKRDKQCLLTIPEKNY